ncbi:MAG: hypothetical protein JST89_02685 [Cyanobacteria bacterium SZAS-4]|nr:hypothetical protein [Cyanobacteria bacterium SZAS-4]
MATFKIRVLSATLCLATLGAQVSAAETAVGTNAVVTPPTVLLSTHGATDTGVAQGEVGKELKGGVSKTEVAPEELIDQLVISAYERDARASEIRAKEGKYRGSLRKSIAKVSDMAQFMTAYKGFQASSEAADVILEEKQKLKSKAAVEWIKQKQHDELHPKVVSSLMQIASGLGMSDPVKQQKNVDVGVKQLASIVGDEDAKRALVAMTAWAASVKESASPIAAQEPLSVLKLDSATKKLMESSLQRDEIVLETKSKLQKYNHRSKLLQATAKVVNSTLSVAMFSPTIVSPAAQIALLAFLMATGGPEEAKLLKELYLDRRIECRYKMINQEATQAINNYNVASITGNTVLVQFCNLTASKMGGKDVLAQAVTEEVADPASTEPTKAAVASDDKKVGASADKKAGDVGMNPPGTSL